MASQTPNHNLNKPADGESPWGAFLRENADIIDAILGPLVTTSVLGRYLRAALPSPATNGQIAEVLDSVRGLFLYQGSQWISIFGEQADVRAWGAKGDGVADDTDAIQAAIDSHTENGGIVFFPPGIYLVTAPLVIPATSDGVALVPIRLVGHTMGNLATGVGAGATGASTILYTGSGACIDLRLGSNSTAVNFHGSIDGLSLRGDGQAGTYGIFANDMKGASIRNVQISNFDVGIDINRDYYYSSWRDVTIRDCLGNGFHSRRFANAAQFYNLRVQNNGGVGLRAQNAGDGLAIVGGYFEGNASYGIHLSDCRNVSIQGGYFENNCTGSGAAEVRTDGYDDVAGVGAQLSCYDCHFRGFLDQAIENSSDFEGYITVIGCGVNRAGYTQFVGVTDTAQRPHLIAIGSKIDSGGSGTIPKLVEGENLFESITAINDKLAAVQFGSPNIAMTYGVEFPAASAQITSPIGGAAAHGALLVQGRQATSSAKILQVDQRTGEAVTFDLIQCTTSDKTVQQFAVRGDGLVEMKKMELGGGVALGFATILSASLTPTSVPAQSSNEQTFSLPGMKQGSMILIDPSPTTNEVFVGSVRSLADNSVSIRFFNIATAARLPHQGTYRFLAIKAV